MLFRRTRPLLMARGKYSSMMDLGGVPAGEVNTRLDYSKNSKLRVVALDFDLITRSLEASRALIEKENNLKASHEKGLTTNSNNSTTTTTKTTSSSILPDVDMVRGMASLFGVTLGGESGDSTSKTKARNFDDDDLSTLIAPSEEKAILQRDESAANYTAPDRTEGSIKSPPVSNARDKYAKRLRDKLETFGGTMTTIDTDASTQRGDASDHFIAKKIAMASSSGSGTGSKWLSTTECGTLLSFLQNRCMKIVLLPIPYSGNIVTTYHQGEGDRMDDLTRQLSNIEFHQLIKHPNVADDYNEQKQQDAKEILARVLHDMNREETTNKVMSFTMKDNFLPENHLLVSDRDDYIKWARESGMHTCRVRLPNARRGNITANFNVEHFGKVEDVVNEINGISFNTVLSMK